MKQCNVPEDWETGLIITICQRKGDAQYSGKYREITLLSEYYEITRGGSGQEVA